MPSRLAACAVCAAVLLAACGEDPATLRVYSSLPAHGGDAEHARAVERGAALALRDAGGRAGEHRVEHVRLTDSTAAYGLSDPGRVADNARRAAHDPDAVAFIGGFNSSTVAISMAVLNEAPLLQLAPAATATGLTSAGPGAGPAEPESHYPTGRRHLVRLALRDELQGRALARLMERERCELTTVAADGGVYAEQLEAPVRAAAQELGLALARARPTGNRGDCFLYLGVSFEAAESVFRAVSTGNPSLWLLGPDSIVAPPFALRAGPAVDRRLLVTAPLLGPAGYPPAGRRVLERLGPDPYGLYGYEAMALALDAVERAGDDGDDPAAVIRSAFATRGRRGVIGSYDVTSEGDTSLTGYGVWRGRRGRAMFAGTVEAE